MSELGFERARSSGNFTHTYCLAAVLYHAANLPCTIGRPVLFNSTLGDPYEEIVEGVEDFTSSYACY